MKLRGTQGETALKVMGTIRIVSNSGQMVLMIVR
jgi:hypothetical protein